ncbi:AbrB/MazE/SpoVT family DNA-binding domain-containing protein [Ensifer soli]|uniref:AbrB/MazE/SpoVT family DNA-binding domain-containing protein n=1 Tax=Ciceribacter sp. sgz301302 TaxID=3342379 RepID=UPI0035BA65DE
MTILTVTEEGQVTLRQELLQHIGVHAGDSVEIDLLPGGVMTIRPPIDPERLRRYFDVRTEDASSFFSLDEIRAAMDAAWVAAD